MRSSSRNDRLRFPLCLLEIVQLTCGRQQAPQAEIELLAAGPDTTGQQWVTPFLNRWEDTAARYAANVSLCEIATATARARIIAFSTEVRLCCTGLSNHVQHAAGGAGVRLGGGDAVGSAQRALRSRVRQSARMYG